ncbi:hypothetical protein L195_g000988 [Trifolium pratense]|uniref:Uncharacterized protein n=1 Tax=Trifolium pratense TaxID=57577 RepID=A0A2K3NNE5_TRIPR|nr:hypothetical protein L195_g000988 [Trifolium pratense]
MASTLQSSHDCTIIDVDDNCLGSPTRADFGGLLCNSAGAWIMGFSSLVILWITLTYFMLNSKLFTMASLLAKHLNFYDVICCTDSSIVLSSSVRQLPYLTTIPPFDLRY